MKKFSLLYRAFHIPWNPTDLFDKAKKEKAIGIHIDVESCKFYETPTSYDSSWNIWFNFSYWDLRGRGRRRTVHSERFKVKPGTEDFNNQFEAYKEEMREAGLELITARETKYIPKLRPEITDLLAA